MCSYLICLFSEIFILDQSLHLLQESQTCTESFSCIQYKCFLFFQISSHVQKQHKSKWKHVYATRGKSLPHVALIYKLDTVRK